AIFTSYCYECHGKDPKNLARKFNVFDPEHRAQRNRVVPGKPEESRLIARVESKDSPMPPSDAKQSPLPPEKAKVLREWIKTGGELEGAGPGSAAVAENRPSPPKRLEEQVHDILQAR